MRRSITRQTEGQFRYAHFVQIWAVQFFVYKRAVILTWCGGGGGEGIWTWTVPWTGLSISSDMDSNERHQHHYHHRRHYPTPPTQLITLKTTLFKNKGNNALSVTHYNYSRSLYLSGPAPHGVCLCRIKCFSVREIKDAKPKSNSNLSRLRPPPKHALWSSAGL